MVRGFVPQEFSPGVAEVPAAKSSISLVNGQTGLLEYRGIRIEELAQQSSFLETTYLLFDGELPAQTELDRFTADMTQHRRIKYKISDQSRIGFRIYDLNRRQFLLAVPPNPPSSTGVNRVLAECTNQAVWRQRATKRNKNGLCDQQRVRGDCRSYQGLQQSPLIQSRLRHYLKAQVLL